MTMILKWINTVFKDFLVLYENSINITQSASKTYCPPNRLQTANINILQSGFALKYLKPVRV